MAMDTMIGANIFDQAAITSARRAMDAMVTGAPRPACEQAAEGGCGVIGYLATAPMAGRFMVKSLVQMHNRGNGKGGGVAALGCFPNYPRHYALHVGYLDPSVRDRVEEKFINPHFDVAHAEFQPQLDDHREAGLEIRPPLVRRYFVRVKPALLSQFASTHGFQDAGAAEDEFVYQNSFALNWEYYASADEKQAFVLSQGRDLMILKGVGYAEEIARYYRLEDFQALGWIGHQRYPTRGRVWHPGGAHPFAGLHEALVHNGDFANYYAVAEYLRQKGIRPLFLTDTEVAALLLDYYLRVCHYDLEQVIEAMAPTTERDFDRLPKSRKRVYRALKVAHIHGSPDGPWFFIVARTLAGAAGWQLIGITDTSMLRPQVFSLNHGPLAVGCIGSEKQAIDALLGEISREHPEVPAVADHYWAARGGSFSDGGAFIYTVAPQADGALRLVCTNKFGERVSVDRGEERYRGPIVIRPGPPAPVAALVAEIDRAEEAKLPPEFALAEGPGGDGLHSNPGVALRLFEEGKLRLKGAGFNRFLEFLGSLLTYSRESDQAFAIAVDTLTLLRDRRYHTGHKARAWVLSMVDQALGRVFASLESGGKSQSRFRLVKHPLAAINPGLLQLADTTVLTSPDRPDQVLVVDAGAFEQEGPESVARLLVEAHRLGWCRFLLFGCKGDRFIGCGMGPDTSEVRIDVYGSSGDYLGSGLDGATIVVHGDAQDQVGQILNRGRLIIHGNVGQTFLYGAKGGEAYVLGNAAGRSLINSVGDIRAIINGTCLDYAAESFMAGEVTGGGFLLVNGLRVSAYGEILGLEDRYPGSNFFSLASGGAGYVNDPYKSMGEDQLNGAHFVPFTNNDWMVILPHLQENEALFGIEIERDLLTVDRVLKWPGEVFRKVVAKTAGQDEPVSP